jgi:protein phosphatase-4 regulatory subunit 3
VGAAAIRFVRAVVGMKDDFYNRHLVKNHLFGPLLTLFEENGVTRTNLIHSAIIDLFEFIRAVSRCSVPWLPSPIYVC